MSTPKFFYVVTDLFGEELYGHVRARGLLGPRPLQVAGVAARRACTRRATRTATSSPNVLVDFRGDAVEVKLCDLGLAAKLPDAPRFAFDGGPPGASPDSVFASLGQYAQPNHGPLFRCCGSMGFFAPDMLDVRGYDATRTDVWSLGCLGLELALGSRVFADFWFRGAGRAALRAECRDRAAPGPGPRPAAAPAATTARAYDVIRGLARPSSAPRAPSLLDAALT
ncbi:serine/threonine kinase [Aureococcus anophagefferens]|nr:serine/threonine kinase [Aureococcus anophagefferens]